MKKTLLSLFIILIISLLSTEAAPIKNLERVMIQPNGDTLHCFVSGDEFYNRLHDARGYTIIQDNDGYYVYATKDNGGNIVATRYIAGSIDPASVGLEPNVMITRDAYLKLRKATRFDDLLKQSERKRDDINKGPFSNINIYIRFAGDNNITTPSYAIDSMFNGKDDDDMSLYNFFQQFSYNQIFMNTYHFPQFEGNLVASYEDIHPRNYYMPYNPTTNPDGYQDWERAEREFNLLQRAVEYVLPMIPDTLNVDCNGDGIVDNVDFIVKGNVTDWATLLWPHCWYFYDRDIYINGARINNFNFQLESAKSYFTTETFCHEMFHSLSAPDLYHYSDPYGLDPAGSWDLMCGTTDPPQSSCVWLKTKYGHWIEELPVITEYGTYTLEANTWEGGRRNGYLIQSSDKAQYYLLQYRDKESRFDKLIPGSGITISRIDTRYHGGASFNGTTEFDEVYVFHPNGSQYQQGILQKAFFSKESERTEFNKDTEAYPWLTGDVRDDTFNICNITDIVDNKISFTFCPLNYHIIPQNVTANVNSNSEITLKWDAVKDASHYIVYRDGNILADNVKDNFFNDATEISNGYHEYSIKAVCGSETSFRSDIQHVMLGEVSSIEFVMSSSTEKGWQGGEIELDFSNSMPTQYLTIYSGKEKNVKISVPKGTEVTARWNNGWYNENCSFIIRYENEENPIYVSENLEEGKLITFTAERDNDCKTPEHLQAEINNYDIELNWISSQKADRFEVFRNNEHIATTTESNYIDTNIPNSGTHIYKVRSIHNDCVSDFSNEVKKAVQKYSLEAPVIDNDVFISDAMSLAWETPGISGKLCYDDGVYNSNIGNSTMTWAICFNPDQLSLFAGTELTHLEMWDAKAGKYTFKIYNGEETSAENLIFTQKYETSATNDWLTIPLDENVAFNADSHLWITVTSSGVSNPGPTCAYTGLENSALIKSGTKWKTLLEYNMELSWMLRAYTNANDTITNELSFNIYRNDELIASGVKENHYLDAELEQGKYYCYTVKSNLNNTVSAASNEICGFISVSETAENKMTVYPNPGKDNIMIKCENATHFEIVSTLGNIVKSVSAEGETTNINTSDLASGIYIIKAKTSTEVFTTRITIIN
ncbi:MAG: T9SS type A sorting domain-containing protein [Candidatus Limimorpha sp.]